MGIETDRPRVRSPGFTHSLLAVFALLATFYLKVPDTWIIPADALQGMVLGYLSHIVADMLTPQAFPYCGRAAGVSACLFWRRAKAINWSDFLCMALFARAVWMPQSMPENNVIRWSSQMITILQMQFNRFINHQID